MMLLPRDTSLLTWYDSLSFSIAPTYSAHSVQSTGIRVELTSTRRTALHRYTFPAESTEPRIVVDLTNDGQQDSTNPVLTLDPDTGRVVGQYSSSPHNGAKQELNFRVSQVVHHFPRRLDQVVIQSLHAWISKAMDTISPSRPSTAHG